MTTRRIDEMGETLNEVVSDLLDGRYNAIADPPIREMANMLNSAEVNQALALLEAECRRLKAEGLKLEPDNEVLLTTVAIIERVIRNAIIPIEDVTDELITTGTEAASTIQPLRAMPLLLAGAVDNPFDDPEYDYSVWPGYYDSLRGLPSYMRQHLLTLVVQGLALGWSAYRVYTRLARLARETPVASAQNSMRTLYLNSYRRGVRNWSEANRDRIAYRIRVAVLDDRTCLTCIALHGQRLPADAEIVDDHPRGRCDSIAVMYGTEAEIETGESWLKRQPEERQRNIMGPANHDAWLDGAVSLSDFVGFYESDIYGLMPVERSLRNILGERARDYYIRR